MLPAKALAFLKRDFLIAVSYRMKFLTQIAGIFISTLMFFFVSRLVGKGAANQLEPYGGDYFAFVLIGVAFTDYLIVSINSFSEEIRGAQMMGTLEAVLTTPTPPTVILFSSSLYSFSFTTLRVILYLAFGFAFFGLEFQLTSFAAFVVVMVLTVFSFWGIGLVSAAFVIVFKHGSPINWLIGSASGLLGGVLYPVSMLPDWLKPVAHLLPITHALEAMRQVLLKGAPLGAVLDEVLILAVFAVVFFSIGIFAFKAGLRIAEKEGSLLHY